MVMTEPAVALILSELLMLNVAPELIVMAPAPRVIVPVTATFPSSTVIEAVVAFPDTVNEPVASVPAEKTASSPDANVVVATVPAGSVLQREPVQAPPGDAPPAPAAAPLMSQYLIVAPLESGSSAAIRAKVIFKGRVFI